MKRETKPYYRKIAFLDYWLKYIPNADGTCDIICVDAEDI